MHSYPHVRQQAQQLADAGDPAGARALLDTAVEHGRPGLAAGDPELLATMRQLASLHASGGDPVGARRLLEEAYAAGQRLGPGDRLMVLMAFDLGVVAEELANRHEARKNFSLVAEHGAAVLGDGHPAVARARGYLASVSSSREGVAGAALETPTAPLPRISPASAPVSVPPVSLSAASSAPVSGGAVSGASLSGGAGPGVPLSGMAVSGLSGSGAAAPVSGAAVSGPPVSGAGVSGPPVSGAPMAPSPFAEPAGGAPRSRTPWVIASAAVVFAVVMLVVVLVRPSDEPDAGTPVAGGGPVTSSAPAATSSGPAPSPAATGAAPVVPGTAKRTQAVPSASTSRSAAAGRTRIVTPKNGAGVARRFTVTFAVSAADVAATDTRLALTVCVKVWCFLDGPIVIADGKARDYTVTLGTGEGEGVGEEWTLRIDRLTRSTYAELLEHKRNATENGTWGDGVTTPIDRLNDTPVSSVVVAKIS